MKDKIRLSIIPVLLVFFLMSVFTLTVNAAEKPGKLPGKLVITGGQMKILNKGQVAEFIGGVKVTRGKDTLIADKMVTDETRSMIKAWGNVKLKHFDEEGNLWQVFGETGIYDSQKDWSRIRGNKIPARAIYTKHGEHDSVLKLTSHQIELSGTSLVAVATGDVYVWLEASGEDNEKVSNVVEGWGQEVYYDDKEGVFEISGGKPKVRQTGNGEKREFTGDKFKYDINTEIVAILGNVHATLLTPSR